MIAVSAKRQKERDHYFRFIAIQMMREHGTSQADESDGTAFTGMKFCFVFAWSFEGRRSLNRLEQRNHDQEG